MKTIKLNLGQWKNKKEMFKALEGYNISDWAKEILKSKNFKLNKQQEVEIAILSLDDLGLPEYSTTKEIREKAESMGYTTPPAEVAPLLRIVISNEEIENLGLWWITTMHKPINDSDGDASLLRARRFDGGRWLHSCYGKPGLQWFRESGFAFVVSPKSLNSDLAIDFLKEFNNISPSNLDDILETLKDNDCLNDKGLKLRKDFWEMFIKR